MIDMMFKDANEALVMNSNNPLQRLIAENAGEVDTELWHRSYIGKVSQGSANDRGKWDGKLGLFVWVIWWKGAKAFIVNPVAVLDLNLLAMLIQVYTWPEQFVFVWIHSSGFKLKCI